MNDEIRGRLTALEKRLARIEQLLGVSESAPAIQLGPPPVQPVYVEPLATAEPVVPSEPIPVIPIEEEILPLPPLPSVGPMGQSPSSPLWSPPEKTDIEQTIGLKWAGWIGAVALVIGAAMGIKYAVDQGWLGQVPPAVRLMLMYAGGFAIIAAGEVVYRRINAISAAAVFGAGVATLFVVSYAGHGLYKLYDPETAFVLMTLSTLIGAAVAVRGKLVSIAILSLIGGNIAPAVLGDSGNLTSFLTYLLMLQIVALVLAWWGTTGKWWILRSFSFVTQTLWMIGVMVSREFNAAGEPLTFSLIYAAMFQLEIIASAIRSRRVGAARGVTFSMIVTAAATAAMLYAFRDKTPEFRGLWVLSFAAVTAILGFTLSLRGPAALSTIAIGYRMQAAALVAVAVPVALSGLWITIAWGVLGLAFVALGRVFNLNISRAAGVVTWLLALANLVHWTIGDEIVPVFHLAGQDIPQYAVLAFILTWVGHGIALLLISPAEPGLQGQTDVPPQWGGDISANEWPALVSAFAGLVWVMAAVLAFEPLGATGWIVAYAWLTFGADRAFPHLLLLVWHAIIAIILAAGKWLVFDTLYQRFQPEWSAAAYSPLLNPVIATGAVIAISMIAIYIAHRQLFSLVSQSGGAGVARAVLLFLLLLIFLWMGTLEIDRYFEQQKSEPGSPRAKQMWLSIYWGLFAIACVVAGFRWRLAGLRYFGLGLFAVTLVKVVFVDLAHIGQGYRILSFMGLGLLLLGTSVLYGKLSPKLLKDPAQLDAEPRRD